ncbi:hypothetical protein FA13DRAFT_1413170 [Coprinellus micaceus]|uniref:Uncharacterized protein n=1 Tax=Coprinellus micaceus TaxID=71717 RepID=A0A4Y7SQ96_COPMI|nr:hypothetical protein FA13DRAFT_1413170 [Coprinellus micaceus]
MSQLVDRLHCGPRHRKQTISDASSSSLEGRRHAPKPHITNLTPTHVGSIERTPPLRPFSRLPNGPLYPKHPFIVIALITTSVILV